MKKSETYFRYLKQAVELFPREHSADLDSLFPGPGRDVSWSLIP